MTAIQLRQLGMQGPIVAPLGYGAMVLEGYYGGVDDAQAVRTIQAALDLGVTMIDTADAYGNGHNERLVGQAVRGRARDTIVIATKFGIVFDGTPATELPTGWGYSLWINRRPEYVRKSLNRSLQTLGIGFVPWSPLGAGFLTGTTQVAEGDFRTNNPRFTGEHARQNADRFAPLHDLAQRLGITSAQLVLAWVLSQGKDIVPIPGTRKPERIAENLASANVRLTAEQLAQIDAIAPRGAAVGER